MQVMAHFIHMSAMAQTTAGRCAAICVMYPL